jgi:hypothetical protein
MVGAFAGPLLLPQRASPVQTMVGAASRAQGTSRQVDCSNHAFKWLWTGLAISCLYASECRSNTVCPAPPKDKGNELCLRRDFINMKNTTEQYDVVVCGGGLAGVSAAVAAARLGAKTCLV